jgi:hypothetical protein
MVLLLLLAESNKKRELHLLAYQSGASSSQAGAAKMVHPGRDRIEARAAKTRDFTKGEEQGNGILSPGSER